MKKRLITLALALALVLSLIPVTALSEEGPAQAQPVSEPLSSDDGDSVLGYDEDDPFFIFTGNIAEYNDDDEYYMGDVRLAVLASQVQSKTVDTLYVIGSGVMDPSYAAMAIDVFMSNVDIWFKNAISATSAEYPNSVTSGIYNLVIHERIANYYAPSGWVKTWVAQFGCVYVPSDDRISEGGYSDFALLLNTVESNEDNNFQYVSILPIYTRGFSDEDSYGGYIGPVVDADTSKYITTTMECAFVFIHAGFFSAQTGFFGGTVPLLPPQNIGVVSSRIAYDGGLCMTGDTWAMYWRDDDPDSDTLYPEMQGFLNNNCMNLEDLPTVDGEFNQTWTDFFSYYEMILSPVGEEEDDDTLDLVGAGTEDYPWYIGKPEDGSLLCTSDVRIWMDIDEDNKEITYYIEADEGGVMVDFYSEDGEGFDYTEDMPWITNCPEGYTYSAVFDDDVKNVGTGMFWGSCLSYVDLGSVEEIGDLAFEDPADGFGLKDALVIPTTCKMIGASAFAGQTEITSVSFKGCSLLHDVYDNAFRGCTSLASVDFTGCTALTSFSPSTFENCSIKELDLRTCTGLCGNIGTPFGSSFGTGKLQTVYLPMNYNSVSGTTVKAEGAFYSNKNMQTVFFPATAGATKGYYGSDSNDELNSITNMAENITKSSYGASDGKDYFIVDYDPNTASGNPLHMNQWAVEGESNRIAGDLPVYDGSDYSNNGQVFLGWNTEPDGTGVTFKTIPASIPDTVAAGDLGSLGSRKVLRLYAQWETAIQGASITLEESTVLNFYTKGVPSADVSDYIAKATYTVSKSGKDEERTVDNVTINEVTVNGTKVWKLSCPIAAAELRSVVTMTIYKGSESEDNIVTTLQCSVEQYLQALYKGLVDNDPDIVGSMSDKKIGELKALVEELANYGSMAQTYFATNAGTPVSLTST